MELYVLDKNFVEIGTISNFDSLIWDRRYYEPGTFEIYVSYDEWEIISGGKYVCRSDNTDTAIIEHIGFGNEGKNVFAKGRMMEALLQDFVIHSQTTFSGTHEAVARSIVSQFAMTKMSKLQLGELSNIGTSIEVQCTGDNVMDKGYEVLKSVDASLEVIYDYALDTLKFRVWNGKDRTSDQSVNTLAVFSDDEGSAESPSYDYDVTDYRNYAYIAGEDSGNNRVIVTLDSRTDSSEDIREVWIDARDLQMEDGMTSNQYKALLLQRGSEKMAEYQISEIVDAIESSNKSLVYRKDFDLGDLCEYINEKNGIYASVRITEVVETYEGNVTTIDLVFGTEKLSATKRILKGVI